MSRAFDYLIVGGGVVGLALAQSLRAKHPGASIAVLEKESNLGAHSSGRNSGVLHAGFYYTADSLKARFCREGNRRWQARCQERGLKLNRCGKVVVAQNEGEQAGIKKLHERGLKNQVNVRVIDEKELREIEPLAKTSGIALHSPDTAVVDPKQCLADLASELEGSGVSVLLGSRYLGRGRGKTVRTESGEIAYGTLINAAGLYADKVARDFGLAKNLTVMPFKGIYLKDEAASLPLRTHVYPVPDLRNPFLGVHFTLTVNGQSKIGPTAIPGFWRENYKGMGGFNFQEMLAIGKAGLSLYWKNAFGFRTLSWEEMRKYNRHHLFQLATALVPSAKEDSFRNFAPSGIRAQLLNLDTFELVQDFLVQKGENSVHVLNAVSPGFTAAMPFADWIVSDYLG